MHIIGSLENVANELKISFDEGRELLLSIKQKLQAVRKNRIPPALDKKILTAWNSLMIKGMAFAGDVLNEPRYLQSAARALDFIQQNLWQNDRLYVSYKDGRLSHPGYIDDYAFLLDALITNLQISWNTQHLEFAIKLAETLLELFADKEHGGFYFTATDQEKVLYRPKLMLDEAIPSGNGIIAQAFTTLGHLLGETRYLSAAENILRAASTSLTQFSYDHCSLLSALNNFLNPKKTIIIRGSQEEMQAWRAACKIEYEVFAIPNDEKFLPGLLNLRTGKENVCAYICEGTHCLAPIINLSEFKKNVNSRMSE